MFKHTVLFITLAALFPPRGTAQSGYYEGAPCHPTGQPNMHGHMQAGPTTPGVTPLYACIIDSTTNSAGGSGTSSTSPGTGAAPALDTSPITNAIQQNNNLNQDIQALGDAINQLRQSSQPDTTQPDTTQDDTSPGVDNSETSPAPIEPQPAEPQPQETVYTINSNPPPVSNEVVTGVNSLLGDDSGPPDSNVISSVNSLLGDGPTPSVSSVLSEVHSLISVPAGTDPSAPQLLPADPNAPR